MTAQKWRQEIWKKGGSCTVCVTDPRPASAGLVVGVFKGRKIDKAGLQDFHHCAPLPHPILPARILGWAGPGYSSTSITPTRHGAWVCSVLSEHVAASSPEMVHVYMTLWVKYLSMIGILEDGTSGKKGPLLSPSCPSVFCGHPPVFLNPGVSGMGKEQRLPLWGLGVVLHILRDTNSH